MIFFHNDKLAKQIDFIDQNPGFKLCHTEEIWIKDGIRINPHKKHKKLHGSIFANSVKICSISISTVMVHKSIFTELGFLTNRCQPARIMIFGLGLQLNIRYCFWMNI